MTNDNGILDSKILIIDDEDFNVMLLEKLLEKEGYLHSKSVTDSRQAATVDQEFQPDLVLLDLNMPHSVSVNSGAGYLGDSFQV